MTAIRIRWAAVGTATVAFAVGITLGMAAQFAVDHQSAPLPPCTDRIADAGGMCEGPLLPECLTEDDDDCAWDATHRGNGTGRSFYVVDGEVTYTGDDARP